MSVNLPLTPPAWTPGAVHPPTPAPRFRLLTSAAGVSFAHRNVQPPSTVYITLGDQLFVEAHVSIVINPVNFTLRLLLPSGDIVTQNFALACTFPGKFTAVFGLAEGFLLAASASHKTTSVPRGRVWVRALLVRGGPPDLFPAQVLIQDALETNYAATWPGGTIRGELEGPGAFRFIAGTLPNVGQEVSETVAVRRRWRLQSFETFLLTSAAAGNRQVQFVINSGVSDVYCVSAQSVQGPSLVWRYDFAVGVPSSPVIATQQLLPLPATCLLGAGYLLKTLTTGLAAGDQWTQPNYVFEEWTEVTT